MTWSVQGKQNEQMKKVYSAWLLLLCLSLVFGKPTWKKLIKPNCMVLYYFPFPLKMYGDPGLNSPELQWHIRTYFVLQFQNPLFRQFLGSFDQNQVKFLLENKIKIKSLLLGLNVVVPSESKLTVATCNWIRALIKYQQLVMALIREHCLVFG